MIVSIFGSCGKRALEKRLTERLFDDNSALVRWVVDDGRCDEVSLSARDVLATSGNFVLMLGDVLEETLDTLILHRVLNRSEMDTLVVWAADLEVGSELGHGLEGLLVDGFVDIDTLGGNADLSTVLESSEN